MSTAEKLREVQIESRHTIGQRDERKTEIEIEMKAETWSCLVEGGEGSNLLNCQTNLAIAVDALSLLFCIFVNTTAYHLGRYEPSSPVSSHAPRLKYKQRQGANSSLKEKFNFQIESKKTRLQTFSLFGQEEKVD